MSKWVKDLTGQKFGKLSVLSLAFVKNHIAHWNCLCDCGESVIVQGVALTYRGTKSCGCLRGDKHGYSKTKLHTVWRNIKNRCKNETHPAYKHYGGKGVRMCEEWYVFSNFKDWALSHGYEEHLTIDRIDNEKGYSPDNCRWADRRTQQRNRSVSVFYNGKTIPEWAEISGISAHVLYARIKYGWTLERAINTPVGKRRKRRCAATVPEA